jgi:hypothetical protein
MDSGWSTVVGAIVGGLTSIGATWLSEYLRNRRSEKLDETRRELLKRMLSGDRYKWRSLTTLADSIGADEETAARLLLEIGARRSMTSNNSWGLISRNPFPDDLPPSN